MNKLKKCQKPKINYLDMEEVINSYWITRKDIMILLPQLTYSSASSEFNKIEKEMQMNNEFYFNTRPTLIPVKKVIDKFHIDVNLIRREANKMRRCKNWNS